jgi:hypothetical protein
MTRFLHWRKMTWTLALWSGLMAAWLVTTAFVNSDAAATCANDPEVGSGALEQQDCITAAGTGIDVGAPWIVALWLVGGGLLGILWFTSRPLWRQGHGMRLRRLASPLTLSEKRAARG